MCSAHETITNRGSTWCTAEHLLTTVNNWIITLTLSPKYNGTSIGPPNETLWIEVDHCVSAGARPWQDNCTVRCSIGILGLVCGLNLFKCCCIGYTCFLFFRSWEDRGHISTTELARNRSLVTIGDAVASFLQKPDVHTEGLDFASAEDFRNRKPWSALQDLEGIRARRRRLYRATCWFKAASAKRWAVTISSDRRRLSPELIADAQQVPRNSCRGSRIASGREKATCPVEHSDIFQISLDCWTGQTATLRHTGFRQDFRRLPSLASLLGFNIDGQLLAAATLSALYLHKCPGHRHHGWR
jgi:hypothetical protein